MAGDRFNNMFEQEALYGMLQKADVQFGWPNRSV
jgi:hypothetical protein